MNDGKNIRVLIAGDRIASRSGFKALLATELEIEMVAEAADGCQALRLVEELQPDVVLMDARMPDMDGLEATRQIKARWPQVRVVVVSMYTTHRTQALAAGADRFLSKGCPVEELLEAICARG